MRPTVSFARGTTASQAPAEALRLSHPIPQDVAATALALEPGFKSFYVYCVVFVERNPRLIGPADVAPIVGQGCLSEQARFNRQDIVASHIAARVVPVEDKVLDHIVRHAPASRRCPR